MGETVLPSLIVISGPMGSGKTTLAHKIAESVGCPAVCRDEIKEGMVHTTPGFVAGPGDELTMRTLPVFFGVLELLLRAGVTTVAEAAFQDRIWRAGLAPLERLARLRIVHCVVAADLAFQRSLRRRAANPLRRAHADPEPPDAAARARFHETFDRVGHRSVSRGGHHRWLSAWAGRDRGLRQRRGVAGRAGRAIFGHR